MLLELRELLKRVSVLQEIRKEKSLNTSRKYFKIWSKLDNNNSLIENVDLLSKPNKKEMNS
jgi:hypothetical protein